MNDSTYIFSDTEFQNLLNINDADVLVGKIFDYYPVNCLNLAKLEYNRLDELCEKLKNDDGTKTETVKAIINLIRAASQGAGEIVPIAEKIKGEIKKNLHCDISLKELSEALGISFYYMLHIFKKSTGKTITEFKNGCRLDAAKKLLESSDKNITEIALECGYANSGYFAESFKQYFKVTPSEYRKNVTETERSTTVLKNACGEDIVFYNMLEHKTLLDPSFDIAAMTKSDAAETHLVTYPTEQYGFLHEAAIIEFGGTLFAAWYNCPRTELHDRTPIRFSKSRDFGKNWTEPKTVVDDPTGEILYCPPVFGVQDGKLYMFVNQMTKPDCIHSLDLYVYDSEADNFTLLWSRGDIPVKLNTNVYTLSNGKLLLPGRWCVRDTFANVPCVLISDSGRIDGEWRIVMIQNDSSLPCGKSFVHPEMSAVIDGETVYIFVRNDGCNIPLLYVSKDNAESWSKPIAHDIPFSDSKIYSGNLSDGRSYVTGNIYPGRETLAILFSEKENVMTFTKGLILQSGKCEKLGIGKAWHYPVAYEYDGKLYVIFTVNIENNIHRGAVVSVIDLKKV